MQRHRGEPDEYGFPLLAVARQSHLRVSVTLGEVIAIFARKYESIALADEALEQSLKPAVEVLERESLVMTRGIRLGLRAIDESGIGGHA